MANHRGGLYPNSNDSEPDLSLKESGYLYSGNTSAHDSGFSGAHATGGALTNNGQDGDGGARGGSFFGRHRKVLLVGSVFMTLGIVALLVTLLTTRPWESTSNGYGGNGAQGELNQGHTGAGGGGGGGGGGKGGNGKGTGPQTPPPRFTAQSTVEISSSVRCNDVTPPLNQPFPYNQQPVRGVNLGGWLVLEPFITPSLFEPYIQFNVTDEYTLTRHLGPDKARALLQAHYATWVTEDTFRRIRDLGLNHVRIPLGYWALGNLGPDEYFVPDLSLDYLLQGLRWAAKYGLRVMVELHGAPGSQNGWNHSGRVGKIRWLDGTPDGEKNGHRTIEVVTQLLKLLQGPGMDQVAPLFGILNEPAIFMLVRKRTDKWYKEAFSAMRNVTGSGKGPWAIIHDGFLGLTEWEGFMPNSDRLVLDVHNYLIFDHYLIRLPREEQVTFPCNVWARNLQQSTLKFGPTLVGEFSSATNDCAKYLNGIGVGYRWDGSFLSEEDLEAGRAMSADEPACQPAKNGAVPGYCSCDTQNDVKSYTPEYRKFLLEFTQTQMDAFEQGMGWFYWNFKTETNPLWSYFDGIDQGWIPKDANHRPGGCTALGSAIQKSSEDSHDGDDDDD
ncbi:hypothetical protein BGW38_005540 [Lunasporangiospora selenospora]|uniref:glucan 1,3-beta-glucosidase n=1 Tax=Lunasporangiospora selenospora TaxID=979761 RepID=A0A9P6KBB8_9FUNG|nr:hypothetical protein BGW38_005540 [Lunasporangiospora selenospora]